MIFSKTKIPKFEILNKWPGMSTRGREELFAELKYGIQFGFPAFLIFCPRILDDILCHNFESRHKNL